MNQPTAGAMQFLQSMWQHFGGAPDALAAVGEVRGESLPSTFAISDLASASIAAAGSAAQW